MPSHPRSNNTNKVIKARRGSRHSSLSSGAQEQLEQFAQQATASSSTISPDEFNVAPAHHNEHDEDDLEHAHHGLENSIDLHTANILGNGASIGGLNGHPSLHPANALAASMASPSPAAFSIDQQQQQQQQQLPDNAPTAAFIAAANYGEHLKIDSALCKKLAGEAAQREPTQRRRDQKLNIERRSNVEALLAHVTGQNAPRPCKNCHKGHGPWTECVVYDGQMCGSCSNCWFNASGSRCTFHENNHPQPLYGPTASSIHHVAAPTPVPAAPGLLAFPPAPVPQASPPSIAGGHGPAQADLSQWPMSDTTRAIVGAAMRDVAGFSQRDRYIARIEAAAKELGMRIAEYDEYLLTPAGVAENQRALELELQHTQDLNSLDQDQDHNHDPMQESPIDNTSSQDGHLS